MLFSSWLRNRIGRPTTSRGRRGWPRLALERLEDRTVPSTSPAAPSLSPGYGRLPLAFEANVGQAAASANYLAHGNGYTLSLSAQQAVLDLGASGGGAVRQTLVGANPAAPAHGLDPLITRSNYLVGDPSQWHTDIPNFGEVEYQGVYKGINLDYHGNQGRLEYDFTVAPGANPGLIQFAIQGARALTLDAKGDLVIHTAGPDVVEQAPLLYQEVNGVRQSVSGKFVLEGNGQVGFRVGAYDKSLPLVIDPTLNYASYLPASVNAVAVDSAGEAYVTGSGFVDKVNAAGTALLYSTTIPATGSGIAVDAAGDAYVWSWIYPAGSPGYVTVLNPTGSGILYSTTLPGVTQPNWGIGGHGAGTGTIAVGGAGNIYVTGTALAGFPTTANAYQPNFSGNGSGDAFFVKINPGLPGPASLVYSTYLGGSIGNGAIGTGITVDGQGNVYIAGVVAGANNTSNFPTTPGALQPNYGGGLYDAFVAKFNPGLSGLPSLVYSTFLGGNSSDGYNSEGEAVQTAHSGPGIAVDSAGDAYVSGSTASSNFPITPGAFQSTFQGNSSTPGGPGGDAFVTKLNPTGSALVYSTFLGGTSRDGASSIALDANNNAFVTCWTRSTDFPTVNPIQAQKATGLDSSGLPNSDVFVARLNSAGSGLVFSTYLGGTDDDFGYGIALDPAANIYVAGRTRSTNFPTTPGALQTSAGSGFISKIFTGTVAGSFGVTGMASPTTAGAPGSVTVTALDGNGNVLTGYTGTVHFLSSDPHAVLPADYTFTAADQGTHTFNVTLQTAGTQSVTAADATNGLLGAETGITVNPAVASTFTLAGLSPANVGVPGSVTVTAWDAFGNRATGYTGTVHFTSSDPLAALPADYTFTGADQGTHTFSATLNTTGTQTVTATDTQASTVTGTEAGITVNPAGLPASTLGVTGFPSPTTAGASGTITISARDANGNVAAGYRGTVHFTSSDPQAVLPADYTFTNTDQGVHTFTLVLKTAGTQSVTATDTGTGSITGSQAGITVNPAAASSFRITAPASVTHGVAFTITVTALDAYGNVATGYTGTVQFSSSDSRATLPANYTFTAADRGVHTFTNKTKLATRGTQTITVTDTANSSIVGTISISVT
jgi:hypothetical protein